MTHVVGKTCDGCRYTDCVVVCPVECFYEGETMLYISPCLLYTSPSPRDRG